MKYSQRDIVEVNSGYTDRDINRRLGSIKQEYFDEIVDKVIESVF